MQQKLQKLREVVGWLSRESKINPALEEIYRYLFIRDIRQAGIEDVFYPVGSAANYSLLYLVLRCVRDLPLTNVLELGAGQTTLLLDKAKRALGAHYNVRTIEHDAFWAQMVRATVAHDVVQAELVDDRVGDRPIAYYKLATIASAGEKFDLVIIDGPPADLPDIRYSRLGCVKVLEQFLADAFVIIVDDAERRGEAAAVAACRDLLRRRRIAFSEAAVAASKRQHVFASERHRQATFF